MRKLFRFWSTIDPQQKSNLIAGGVVLAAIGFLRIEAAPIPAGSETIHIAAAKSPELKFERIAKPAEPVAADTADMAIAASEAVPSTPEDASRQTLERKLAMVQAGIAFLKKTPDYTALFMKQELVGGELTDEQEIEMKVRHEPFSVYLKWMSGERGREVLYVHGQNDGEMVVRSGGWKSKLGPMSLEPDGTLAMREARYPITRAGLLELALLIESYHIQDLATQNVKACEQLADQEFSGRSCGCFLVEYKDASVSPNYRKSITLIDKEWSVPVYIKNYTWPAPDQESLADEALDEATLVEFYSYSDVHFRQQLADSHFDRNNEEYRLQ